ncbi:MAG TPA: SDR family NAD(P)-dependent oxidoreductase [Bryobacterales bacterium]|nr:SDR family NAD(P)-dependent oxidoreductase [Bryobacterales bacterium]
MNLENKVVLITGASAGIGEACAQAFARRRARLILTARSADALDRVCWKVAPAQATAIRADLRDPPEVEALIKRAQAVHGHVDVLINNAGVGVYVPCWQADPLIAREMMEVNFFAPLALIHGLVPLMRERGVGMIVNVSSIAGKVPLPWLTLYSASKAALNFLSDGLRMELREAGIGVVSVCPGYVRTDFPQHVLAGEMPPAVADRKHFTITARQCAEAIVRGVEKEKRTVVTPRSGWVFVAIARLLPGRVHRALARMQAPSGY